MTKIKQHFSLILLVSVLIIIFFYPQEKTSAATIIENVCSDKISVSGNDSLYLKMYLADRDYFLKLQETVTSKNQYIGLQWCIDLLNKYIEAEERTLKSIVK